MSKGGYFMHFLLNFLLIFLGGGFGALLRFISTFFIDATFRFTFPLGTLCVNMIGSLLVGILYKTFETFAVINECRLLIMVGFLGGYTTFSTYALETVKYIVSGNYKLAILNAIANNLLCLIFVIIGIIISKAIIK